MLYHQLMRWRAMAWALAKGSKRYISTEVAPENTVTLMPINMPAMWYSGAMAKSTSSA